jgi:Fur family ferric uptake transcriptional regulator
LSRQGQKSHTTITEGDDHPVAHTYGKLERAMTRTDLNTQARRMLKAVKLYCTRSRVSILKVLIKMGKPLSQEQIARLSGKEHFDKVTIYRTLESLVKVGLVHKAMLDKRAQHYELANNCTERQCHPHFTCTNCGDTHCLTEISLPMAKSPHRGFIIQRQQVRLEGLCPKCA